MIEEVTPSGSVYYVREPSGALIARVSGGGIHYYHFDALGSTGLLTDADGDVTDTYSYDAWGNLTARTGETDQPYQYVGQLGYYTHYQDENLDLLQLGVRFYDSETGRFTQMDSVGQGLNWYEYVSGNPAINVDPSGLKAYRESPVFTQPLGMKCSDWQIFDNRVESICLCIAAAALPLPLIARVAGGALGVCAIVATPPPGKVKWCRDCWDEYELYRFRIYPGPGGSQRVERISLGIVRRNKRLECAVTDGPPPPPWEPPQGRLPPYRGFPPPGR